MVKATAAPAPPPPAPSAAAASTLARLSLPPPRPRQSLPPPKFLPTIDKLSESIATRVNTWSSYLARTLEREARGEQIADSEPWLHEWREGSSRR